MIYIFYGPPGSGKGSQSQLLCQRKGFSHYSTGNMLREEAKTGSPVGQKIRKALDEGRFADEEIVTQLIDETLKKIGADHAIFDGYPRTIEQVRKFDQMLNKHSIPLGAVIYFDINEETLRQRIQGRIVCKTCNAVYNENSQLPKVDGQCDFCGGREFIRRADDDQDIMTTRYHSFVNETQPILDFYKKNNKLAVIDASQPLEVVYESVVSVIENSMRQ